jgi:alpha-ketoglutarate-dependent taurine dioxygenase
VTLVSLKADVERNGFAFLPAYRADISADTALPDIGPIVKFAGAAVVQRLEVRSREAAPPNTYGGHYGNAALPLHTDFAHWFIPPRYLALRCVCGNENVATRLLDGRYIVADIGVAELRRTLVRPRRAVKGRRPLLHLLQHTGDADLTILRWDELFLVPASSASNGAFVNVKERIYASETHTVVLRDVGDTLVVDNWRILHGRSSAVTGRDRVLERAYFGELR